MKVRNGFVSNSSSSSFIIDIPEREMSLSEVEGYYGFREDVDPILKSIMTYYIWRALVENRKMNEEEDYWYGLPMDNITFDYEVADYFLESLKWECDQEYYQKNYNSTPQYYENVKSMLGNGLKKMRIEVDSNGNYGNYLISNHDSYLLDEKSEFIFDKDNKELHAFGVSEH